ncbi:MAG: amidohydrolase [Calditrichaeota bacterium]|nr:amidohydrolase [Calditrichota bacterium]MCB9369127.1 amidohydrolase [Calditrichota bacterium]
MSKSSIILFTLVALFSQAFADVPTTVRAIYEQLHAHPELGNKEFETSKLIRSELEEAGYSEFVDAPSLKTEIITVLRTGRAGKTICLRADLDALPIDERSGLSCVSSVPGRMHACGHDAHSAMLLGAALELKNDPNVSGTIVFLWQPAEEVKGGADDVIADSVLQKLGVEAVFGQHVFPGLPVGVVRIAPGPVLAGSNYYSVTVNGRGSHAAYPHQGDDVPTCLANIVAGLTGLPARKMNVLEEPCIMSVGWIECDTAKVYNALPDAGSFGGTVRAYVDIADTLQNGGTIESLMETYITKTAEAFGCTAELRLRRGAPVTVNDPKLCSDVLNASDRFPALHADGQSIKRMTAEDFAYYTQVFPSLYFSLGIAKDGLGEAGLHTSEFTIHPDALEVGTNFLVWLAEWSTNR